MPNQSAVTTVEAQLQRAMESGLLPEQVQTQAEKTMTRLHQPVRLALLGLPGSGKSSLLNLLVNSEVITEGVRLPSLQLTYAAQEQAICTLPDGSKTTLPTVNAAEIAALSPVFVELQMPLAALKKISVLETVAPADPTPLHRASQWASKRADVVLWCTKEFTDLERSIWSQMPDAIKDHGLLMITHMDELQANGLFDGIVGAAKTATMGEFDRVLPIDVRSALSARQPDGNVDKARMRISGGLALIKAVLKQVDQGIRFATDIAEVLLLKHADILAPLNAEPLVLREPIIEEEDNADQAGPDAQDSVALVRNLAAQRALEEDDSSGGTISAETRAAYVHVVDELQDRAAALQDALDDLGDTAPAEVIATCVEQIQWACDYLSENGTDGDQHLERARDTAFDAADLIQLMQMEKRDSAAIEAVTLMLQVKREIQADLAA